MNVQISEKEVAGIVHEIRRDQRVNNSSRPAIRRGSGFHGHHQAAAENEHVVVVGSQGGQRIERVVFRSEENLA